MPSPLLNMFNRAVKPEEVPLDAATVHVIKSFFSLSDETRVTASYFFSQTECDTVFFTPSLVTFHIRDVTISSLTD